MQIKDILIHSSTRQQYYNICFQSKTEVEYLINYCLMSSEQYLSYIQAKNKTNKKKNYVEIRTGMAQQGQRLLSATATGKIWRFG